MRSHSVKLTLSTGKMSPDTSKHIPPLPQLVWPVLELRTPEGGEAELTWMIDWLHTEMVYPSTDGRLSKY